LAKLPALRLIAAMGAGYDQIDVRAAAARGVLVTHTPDAVTEDTADCAFALMLNCVRRFPAAERFLRAGQWAPGAPFGASASLRGKTLGIVGLGRVGKAIARRAEAFGLSVRYTGRSRQSDVAYPYESDIVALARASDILLNATPGGAGTQKLIGADAFAALGSKGYFVNIGRGTSVDEAALIAALRNNAIAGAGLDVFAQEPAVPDELTRMENVVLLPHVGGATFYVAQRIGADLLANVAAFARGARPPNPVPETPWRG
jgi:lactate dehydrogenase-like 2-hydroxyacid dehydrogenase